MSPNMCRKLNVVTHEICFESGQIKTSCPHFLGIFSGINVHKMLLHKNFLGIIRYVKLDSKD